MFYRNRVIGTGTGTSGFVLEPCRGDNLNMWFECSFENLEHGIAMVGNDVPVVASSQFNNCGQSISGTTNKAMLNSLVHVGPRTQWALPAGNDGFIEGCTLADLTRPAPGSLGGSC